MNFTKSSKITRVSNAAAAGQTAVNSSSVDMTGFDAVTFLAAMGSITAGAATSLKVQTSSDDSNWSDLEGTSVTIADDDDNQLFGVEVNCPRERYLRAVISRATQDSVVDGIVAIQTKRYSEPVTQPATTTIELHHAPAEGTA